MGEHALRLASVVCSLECLDSTQLPLPLLPLPPTTPGTLAAHASGLGMRLVAFNARHSFSSSRAVGRETPAQKATRAKQNVAKLREN